MFKLLVVLAFVGVAMGAATGPQGNSSKLERKSHLESIVFAKEGWVAPERVMDAVVELNHTIYSDKSIFTEADEENKRIVGFLYHIGRPNEALCGDDKHADKLDEFSQEVEAFMAKHKELVNVRSTASNYKEEQYKLCMQISNTKAEWDAQVRRAEEDRKEREAKGHKMN